MQKMKMRKSYTLYTSKSGNTQILVYKRRPVKRRLTESEKEMISQKLMGLLLIIMGAIGTYFFKEDCGGFLFTALLGLCVVWP